MYVVIRSVGNFVLKPMMKKDLFLREVALYEDMYSQKALFNPTPKEFVPTYYGVHMMQSSKGIYLPYLVLGDVNVTYRKPCVIDIKMGQQTFEPTASDEKKRRECLKYPYQSEMGFRVTGMKVYDVLANGYVSFTKVLGINTLPQYVQVTHV